MVEIAAYRVEEDALGDVRGAGGASVGSADAAFASELPDRGRAVQVGAAGHPRARVC